MQRQYAAELLARLHDAQNELYRGGEPTAVHRLLAADIAWHVPGDNLIAGDYHGRDAVIGYMLRRRDIAGSTMCMHPLELLVGDDHVACRTDGIATIDGTERRWSTLGLYRIGADRIRECWLLPLDPYVFDAVWSRPASRDALH